MIVLASASPRRRELLSLLVREFAIDVPDVDESRLPGERVEDLPERLALLKARTVAARRPDDLVIAADTVVHLDGDELGKPRDAEEHGAFLRRLSGRSHTVSTGVAIVERGREHSFTDRTEVDFRPLDEDEIVRYVTQGDGRDKAGGYAIQGGAIGFARNLHGSLATVVGFPVHLLGILRENSQ